MKKCLLFIFAITSLCFVLAFGACGIEPNNNEQILVTYYTVTLEVNNAEYGSVDKTVIENVAKDTAITFNGNKLVVGDKEITATATEADARFVYSFKNWTTASKVTEDIKIIANFTRTTRKYTVTFDMDGGTFYNGTEAISSLQVEYGTSASELDSYTKAKEGYKFDKWQYNNGTEYVDLPANAVVESDISLKAIWIRVYTIIFKNIDGTILQTDYLEFGEMPVYNGTPEIENDENWIYEFTGWDNEIVAVTGDAVYTATFDNKIENVYGYMHAILYKADNAGDGIVFDDANGIATATASADNMYVYLKHQAVTAYGEGKDFLKLTVSSPDGASFLIVPMNDDNADPSIDGNWTYYTYDSVMSATTYYIPLNDSEVHDWSKYDVRLYVGYNEQVLKIEEIAFKTLEERIAEMPVISRVIGGSASDNVYTSNGSPMYVYINHEYVQTMKKDKTFIKFVLSSSGGAEFNILPTNSSGTQDWYYVYETLFSETYYVPLNDSEVHDFSKYDLALVVRTNQNLTISEMSFVTIDDFPDFIYAVRRGSTNGNSYTATEPNMELYISMWRVRYEGEGKDYLKLTLSATAMTEFTLKLDNNRYYYQTLGGDNNVFYVPLADIRIRDMNSHWLSMVAGNVGGNITIDNIEYVTQAEKDAA